MSADEGGRSGGPQPDNQKGMMPREEWAETDVHKVSRYACGWCGKEFEMPHDFYDHLDTEHPKKKGRTRDR